MVMAIARAPPVTLAQVLRGAKPQCRPPSAHAPSLLPLYQCRPALAPSAVICGPHNAPGKVLIIPRRGLQRAGTEPAFSAPRPLHRDRSRWGAFPALYELSEQGKKSFLRGFEVWFFHIPPRFHVQDSSGRNSLPAKYLSSLFGACRSWTNWWFDLRLSFYNLSI